MKMKLKKITMLILLVGILFLPVLAFADSGFDTSYDTGGGDYSSHSSSNSYSSSSYDSDLNVEIDDSVAVLIIVILFVFFSIYIISMFRILLTGNEKEVSDELLNKLLVDLNKEELKEHIFEYFVKLQNAWMNFDDLKLREMLTDEMYNMYTMQLNTLKIKNQKNIMSDFEKINVTITGLKEENKILIMDVYLDVKFYDYIIDTNNNYIIKGTKRRRVNNLYKLTFVRNVTPSNKKINCPNCGSKVMINSSGKCEYCESIIVTSSDKWVLSKKEIKRQM